MKAQDYKNEILYDAYFDIAKDAYHEKIRYFESNLEAIMSLPFTESIKIELDYALALNKVGAYAGFLRKADRLIQAVVRENIFTFNGKDIYKELLFCKAQSYYRIYKYPEANHVLEQLVKIEPTSLKYQKLYKNLQVDYARHESQKVRGFSIALFLLAGIVIAFELLLVRSFYFNLLPAVVLLRNVALISGIFLVLINEWHIRRTADKNLNSLIS
mgnify:CR=1 FL=1|jgi:hypothetical protein